MKKVKKFICATLVAGMILPTISSSAFAADGTWKHNSKGWWYSYSDGTYAQSTWLKDAGKWYYFNDAGYMFKGWLKEGGKWYYMSASGAMAKGWKKISDVWYYFAGSGAMVKGWKKIKDVWYYFAGSGAMITGWKDIKGVTYYFDENGAMATGVVVIDGEEYEFDENGAYLGSEIEDPVEDPIVGGWDDPSATPVTKAQQDVFDKATKGMTGATYTAVAYLGQQVVAGTNHRFFCKQKTIVSGDVVMKYGVMTIFEDLDGNTKITSIEVAKNVIAPQKTIPGGYDEPRSMFLDDENRNAKDNTLSALDSFNEAKAKTTGVDYTPLLYLGDEAVTGNNYRFLCYAKPVTQNPQGYYVIVTIYQGLEDGRKGEFASNGAFEKFTEVK